MLATGSIDGTARLWNIGFTSWVTTGCKLVNRNLSLAERDLLAAGLRYAHVPEPAGRSGCPIELGERPVPPTHPVTPDLSDLGSS